MTTSADEPRDGHAFVSGEFAFVWNNPLGKGGFAQVFWVLHKAAEYANRAVKVCSAPKGEDQPHDEEEDGAPAEGKCNEIAFFELMVQRAKAIATAAGHPGIRKATFPPSGTRIWKPYETLGAFMGEGSSLLTLTLTNLQLKAATYQLLKALLALHEQAAAHRDLQPRNIMMDAKRVATGPGALKLLDFGLASHPPPSGKDWRKELKELVFGTPGYWTPEAVLIQRLLHINEDADLSGLPLIHPSQHDVFQAGVLLLELHLCRRLFRVPCTYVEGNMSEEEVFKYYTEIYTDFLGCPGEGDMANMPAVWASNTEKFSLERTKEKIRAEAHGTMAEDAIDLCARMISYAPHRPSIAELLQHPYMKDPALQTLKDAYSAAERGPSPLSPCPAAPAAHPQLSDDMDEESGPSRYRRVKNPGDRGALLLARDRPSNHPPTADNDEEEGPRRYRRVKGWAPPGLMPPPPTSPPPIAPPLGVTLKDAYSAAERGPSLLSPCPAAPAAHPQLSDDMDEESGPSRYRRVKNPGDRGALLLARDRPSNHSPTADDDEEEGPRRYRRVKGWAPPGLMPPPPTSPPPIAPPLGVRDDRPKPDKARSKTKRAGAELVEEERPPKKSRKSAADNEHEKGDHMVDAKQEQEQDHDVKMEDENGEVKQEEHDGGGAGDRMEVEPPHQHKTRRRRRDEAAMLKSSFGGSGYWSKELTKDDTAGRGWYRLRKRKCK
ncbi:unnamed protein product [Vitrella brassicaformis CCMP3155]|uniref:non-specific serine/threonine protein kinase n=1 Tax=Vitrella brassicaformis (strain CCMP3155) TaxID=1169540 RepID=A0A0G4ETY8_VITBC|nr:unnamed protein product [Vitrella brassicaformis CCMP3155]|eukprot:CEM02092.1 unnamed protein product [Vitrella brassicaformis CCMP3155]